MLYSSLAQSSLICSQHCTSITITLEQNKQTKPWYMLPATPKKLSVCFLLLWISCSGLFAVVEDLRQDLHSLWGAPVLCPEGGWQLQVCTSMPTLLFVRHSLSYIHMYAWSLGMSEEGVGCPETGGIGSCEPLWYGCWGPNPGPLKISKCSYPSLHPLVILLIRCPTVAWTVCNSLCGPN